MLTLWLQVNTHYRCHENDDILQLVFFINRGQKLFYCFLQSVITGKKFFWDRYGNACRVISIRICVVDPDLPDPAKSERAYK